MSETKGKEASPHICDVCGDVCGLVIAEVSVGAFVSEEEPYIHVCSEDCLYRIPDRYAHETALDIHRGYIYWVD